MDTKPVVTYYAKNTNLPDKLKDKITINLPEECIEWQRSYGRSTKKVYLEANLVPFKDAALKDHKSTESGTGKHRLLGRCLLHTYWFECSDIDVYKSQIREDVISWMNRLRENDILDWLIVVVDSSEKKKSNKTKLLPRSTVADKVRSDFPSCIKDAADRCVCLVNPLKNETSAGDSYVFFLDRLRLVLLKSYSKHLTRYEDYVRSQRERRNSKSWDFFSFFILQEEMAFAFEMLSLYDDALIQYDELDALFSQFVINSHVIQPPDWLKVLIERCHSWAGLTLSKTVSTQLREKICNSTASLLDLRNYLFSRQCELLLLQHKPWELSTRALPFLHNCVNELNILEINLPQGAVACWVFLSALEILQKCERYNDSSQMQIYSRYTIGLWAYARRKLEELGTLCGLMPGMNHDSECIHKVVSLIAGMGNDPYSDEKLTNPSPQTELKEALSKPEAFTKAYLEVSELTISTYKHIGRFRSGRLVGRELAFLYMKMDKHQQSIPFLLDLEKIFTEDRWKILLFDTRKNILDCFLVLNDTNRVLQYSLLLASSSILEIDDRVKYLTIAKEKLSSLTNIEKSTSINMEEIFPVRSISIKSDGVFVTNSQLELSLTLESNLLETLSFASIRVQLSYEPFTPPSRVRTQDKQITAKNSLLCSHPFSTLNSSIRKNIRARPKFETYHDTSSGYEVGIRCPNLNQVFKRLSVESTNGGSSSTLEIKHGSNLSVSGNHFFTVNNININPGINDCTLIFEPLDSGCYTIEGIQCFWKHESIIFTHPPLPVHLCFTVISEEPSLKLIGKDESDNLTTLEILSGPPQAITLRLNSGSYCFQPGSTVTLKSSTELFIKLSPSSNIQTNGDGNGGDEIDNIDDSKSNKLKSINYSPLEILSDNCETSDLIKDYSNSIDINFKSSLDPFQNYDIPLTIVSKFAHQRGNIGTEHNIILSYPDAKSQAIKSISRILYLTPPFMSTIKLYSLTERKFIEITVRSVSRQRFELFDANLIANEIDKDHNNDFILKSFNSPRKMIVYKDQTVHYVWEIFSTDTNSLTKLLFSLKYNPVKDDQISKNPLAYYSYDCDFTIKSIKSTSD